jgi:transcriptional regulator with XRE-family HTH domain
MRQKHCQPNSSTREKEKEYGLKMSIQQVIFEKIIEELRRRYQAGETQTELGKRLRVSDSTINRWFSGVRGGTKKSVDELMNYASNLEMDFDHEIAPLLEKLGGKFDVGQNTPREVVFVDAKRTAAAGAAVGPIEENYFAVPMVGEVGAGPGIIPQDEIRSWVLVFRDHHSVRQRHNLLAVEIGKSQTSMMPTLHPLDIVLVDRDDWGQQGNYSPPGNIFMVREPGQEGGAMVKRVAVAGRGETSTVTFYSDNRDVGPETYLLSLYEFDLRRAIVGKVVWSWVDLSRK